MGRTYAKRRAEDEATAVGRRFMQSRDVVGDMSRAYGTDLSDVNIHTDEAAAQKTAGAGVDAFASGKDVFFAKGAFDAAKPESRGLLAHELSHTMQQSGSGGMQASAPMGEMQGGMLDWFKRLFRTNNNDRAQERPQTVAQMQDEGELDFGIGFGDGASYGIDQEETEMSEEETTEESGEETTAEEEVPAQWRSEEDAKNSIDESSVLTRPIPPELSEMSLQSSRRDGLWQNPVLETHSFVARSGMDGNTKGLHSYTGLRFTMLDPTVKRYRRKEMKVGFGMGGLMDDTGSLADISTETPLTKNRMDTVLDTMAERSQLSYNFFTNNCNHFTQEVAKAGGATVPAELHDSILGPLAAYRNIGKAAEGGEQDRTRFFQGGGNVGQMAQGSGFLESFYKQAESAARWDFCPFLLYPRLAEEARALGDIAREMAAYDNNNIVPDGEITNFLALMDRAKAQAKRVVELQLRVTHPRVNMASLKVAAIADQMRYSVEPKEERSLEELTQTEIAKSLTDLTDNEEDTNAFMGSMGQTAGTIRSANLTLSDRSVSEQVGEILLKSLGVSARGRDMGDVGNLFAKLGGDIEDSDRIAPYLEQFAGARPNLNTRQLAHLVMQSMLMRLQTEGNAIEGSFRSDMMQMEMFHTEMFRRGNKKGENKAWDKGTEEQHHDDNRYMNQDLRAGGAMRNMKKVVNKLMEMFESIRGRTQGLGGTA